MHIQKLLTIALLTTTTLIYANPPDKAPTRPSKTTSATPPARSASDTEELTKITKSSAFMFAVTQATIDSCPTIPKNLSAHFAHFLKTYENHSVASSLGKTGVSTYRAEFVSNYQRMMTEFTKAKPSDVLYLCQQTTQQLPEILIDLYSRSNLPIPSDIQQKTNPIP